MKVIAQVTRDMILKLWYDGIVLSKNFGYNYQMYKPIRKQSNSNYGIYNLTYFLSQQQLNQLYKILYKICHEQ